MARPLSEGITGNSVGALPELTFIVRIIDGRRRRSQRRKKAASYARVARDKWRVSQTESVWISSVSAVRGEVTCRNQETCSSIPLIPPSASIMALRRWPSPSGEGSAKPTDPTPPTIPRSIATDEA